MYATPPATPPVTLRNFPASPALPSPDLPSRALPSPALQLSLPAPLLSRLLPSRLLRAQLLSISPSPIVYFSLAPHLHCLFQNFPALPALPSPALHISLPAPLLSRLLPSRLLHAQLLSILPHLQCLLATLWTNHQSSHRVSQVTNGPQMLDDDYGEEWLEDTQVLYDWSMRQAVRPLS